MESSAKLDKDFNDLNRAVEEKAEQEIQKIRVAIDALKAEAAKTAQALTKQALVSEKDS